MLFRFGIALILGAIIGIERELVGKEAGVRTEMVVAGGASIFAMIGIVLPFIVVGPYAAGPVPSEAALIGGFGVIASIVTGIGFLGAGLIIKMNDHPRGITTAALVWTTAGIGVLAGIGLIQFAAAAAFVITILLYILRKLDVSERLERRSGQ